MPKDWDYHKAEIERLYMVERRPLKDVRNILKTQFAFDASVRAYRMKLDEWRLWKNNSKTERRNAKTVTRHRSRNIEASGSEKSVSTSIVTGIQSPPPVDVPMTLVASVEIYGVLVPIGPLDISDLLPLISNAYSGPPFAGLEIILMKWKSDGKYLKAALNYLWDNRVFSPIYHHTQDGTSIFHLIDTKLDYLEKFSLSKRCLEIDFELFQGIDERLGFEIYPEWKALWRKACALRSWDDVKKCLEMISPEFSGRYLFNSTALSFLAEKLLQKNMELLEQWRTRGALVTANEAEMAITPLRESMDILSSFKTDNFGIDTMWYKIFLQFLVSNESLVKYQKRQLEQLEECQKKLLQLKTLHESVDGANGLVQNLLNTANFFQEIKATLDTVQPGDVSFFDESLTQRPSTPTTAQPETLPSTHMEVKTLLENVYKRWSWGEGIKGDVVDLLEHIETHCSSGPLSYAENIFILISAPLIVPPRDKVCFTVDILTEIDILYDFLPLVREKDWDAWLIVHNSSNLRKLQEIVDLSFPLKSYLDDHIQSEAVELILNAFLVLAGERILFKTLKKITRYYRMGGDVHETGHAEVQVKHFRRVYIEILDNLHARNLKVSRPFYTFLGDLLAREATDKLVFESSEEGSGDSEDDSTESDIEPT